MKNLIATIAILMLSVVSSFAQTPSYIDTNKLGAWYPFTNGTLTNYADNSTATGTATFRADRKHIANNSAYTNGAPKSYFDLGNCYYNNTTQLTISLWVKLDNAFAVKGAYMLSDYKNGFNIGIGCDNDSSYFMYRNNRITTTGINDTNWHNFVAIIDDNNMYLYIDDTLKTQKNVTIGTIYKGNFIIGFANTDGHIDINSSTSTLNFDGRIDDIAIWGKAISRTEITNIYKAIETGTSISNIYNNPNISIAPNPAQNNICVQHNTLITNVEIYNISGALVYRNNPNTKLTNINISNLIAGTYIIKVNTQATGSDRVTNSINKIVKQ